MKNEMRPDRRENFNDRGRFKAYLALDLPPPLVERLLVREMLWRSLRAAAAWAVAAKLPFSARPSFALASAA
jgi:hypothetical protein